MRKSWGRFSEFAVKGETVHTGKFFSTCAGVFSHQGVFPIRVFLHFGIEYRHKDANSHLQREQFLADSSTLIDKTDTACLLTGTVSLRPVRIPDGFALLPLRIETQVRNHRHRYALTVRKDITLPHRL
jgi:hypothetical protein